MQNEINSANTGAGFLIRNGRTGEECYLVDVGKDIPRDLEAEAFGDSAPKRGRKWKCVESREKIAPKSTTTSIWTQDETLAMYFGSRAEAQDLIKNWHVLQMAGAYVVQA